MTEDTYKGDPSDPLSLNYYGYVKGNPLKYVDPSGHSTAVAPMGLPIIIDTGIITDYKNNKMIFKATDSEYKIETFPSMVDNLKDNFRGMASDRETSTMMIFKRLLKNYNDLFTISSEDLDQTFQNMDEAGEYLSKKAPLQVEPGTKKLSGQYVDDLERVQPWVAHYDEFGRIEGRTDFNAGNKKAGIPETHYHTYEWGRGMNPKEISSHVKGRYKP